MNEELAVIEHGDVGDLVPVQHGTGITVAPEVSAADLVRRLDVIRDAMRNAMERDVDYGVIPGTGSKPTLLKPGSEKLGVLFQLDIQIENEKTWGDDGHLTVCSRATVYHAPTGTRLGSGEGMCSTREAKYAWRNQSRKCPSCGAEAIIKGKAEYGGGWVCFKKKDGCGAKFADEAPEITSQTVGRIPNSDLADTYNTVLKMSEKRGRIDAVLAVTGASALFTQDVGDDSPGDDPPAQPETRTDGKESPKLPTSWSQWEEMMRTLGVPEPLAWLEEAALNANIPANQKGWGKVLSQKANSVLVGLAENPDADQTMFPLPALEPILRDLFKRFFGVEVNGPEAVPFGEPEQGVLA